MLAVVVAVAAVVWGELVLAINIYIIYSRDNNRRRGTNIVGIGVWITSDER